MKINDYIKAIESCPDEIVEFEGGRAHKLNYNFGVYDNFPILTNSTFEDLSGNLEKMGLKITKKGSLNWIYRNFDLGKGIELKLRDKMFVFNPHRPELKDEIERQKENFNITMILLNEHHKDLSFGSEFLNDMKKSIIFLSNYLKENGFSFCFPQTYGLKEPLDPSKIVYYFPSKENQKGGQTQ